MTSLSYFAARFIRLVNIQEKSLEFIITFIDDAQHGFRERYLSETTFLHSISFMLDWNRILFAYHISIINNTKIKNNIYKDNTGANYI